MSLSSSQQNPSTSSSTSSSNLNSKQRIDMGHGFMKSVIKNQIDRDNYDKEVKDKKTSSKPVNKPRRSKKPELQTYVPPQRSKPENGDWLFCLHYEHENGEVMRIHVTRNDEAHQLAKKVGMKFDLPNAFVSALTQRIQEEMEARQS